jgi:hypothetical protein
MPHIQSNLDLPTLIHQGAMSFIPRHGFFEDIYPFSRSNFDPRSDNQLQFLSMALGLSYDGAEGVVEAGLDSHLDYSLSSTAE